MKASYTRMEIWRGTKSFSGFRGIPIYIYIWNCGRFYLCIYVISTTFGRGLFWQAGAPSNMFRNNENSHSSGDAGDIFPKWPKQETPSYINHRPTHSHHMRFDQVWCGPEFCGLFPWFFCCIKCHLTGRNSQGESFGASAYAGGDGYEASMFQAPAVCS